MTHINVGLCIADALPHAPDAFVLAQGAYFAWGFCLDDYVRDDDAWTARIAGVADAVLSTVPPNDPWQPALREVDRIFATCFPAHVLDLWRTEHLACSADNSARTPPAACSCFAKSPAARSGRSPCTRPGTLTALLGPGPVCTHLRDAAISLTILSLSAGPGVVLTIAVAILSGKVAPRINREADLARINACPGAAGGRSHAALLHCSRRKPQVDRTSERDHLRPRTKPCRANRGCTRSSRARTWLKASDSESARTKR